MRGVPRPPRAPGFPLVGIVLAALALSATSAPADKVVPKRGPPLKGAVTRTDTEVIVNKYGSHVLAMKYGVTRLPLDAVKRVEEEPVPEEVVRRKHDDLKPDDARGRVDLAKTAISQKVRTEAARLLEEALAIDPGNAEALSLYGGPERWQAAKRGNPVLDRDLQKDLRAYLAMEDGAARAKEAQRIEAAHGFPAKAEVLERMWASGRRPKGLQEDVPITLRSDRHPGGRYTVLVPETYDPLVPTPLLFALHGGGRGGKEGDQVVGSGREAVTLYHDGIALLGWILVCPTALAAPWAATGNEPFLLSCLEEIEATYNVDLDRVYLTGHSMGGFGTWWFGPRHLDLFAAIGPTASGGPGGFKALKDARTGIYVYHSADDPICPVAPIQPAVETLLESGADVVYLQLEDRGHSLPPEAVGELFDVFRVKRLADAKRPSAWPRSSFQRKPTKDEERYLGDPAVAWGSVPAGAPAGSLKELLAELERGGGGAERAAAAIASQRPEGSVKAVARVLSNAKTSDDARSYAARCLGDLGDVAGVDALSDAVLVEKPSRLVREAAVALRKIGNASAADALGKAAAAWSAQYAKRLQGPEIDYPDWEEVCVTLADVVEAFGVCGPPNGGASAVERLAVKAVLERREKVHAEARAGQDPSRPRQRLAEAVARAYATLSAPDLHFAALETAVSGDGAAGEAVRRGRESPFSRHEPAAPPK